MIKYIVDKIKKISSLSNFTSKKKKLLFINKLKKRRVEGKIIVTFGNMEFLPVIMNWLVSLDKLEINNCCVICFDTKLYDFLSKRNISAVNMEVLHLPEHLGFWQKRMHVLNMLLENGIDFIHSDADAIWLKNPSHLFEKDADLIVSQGTTWPRNFFNRHGFTLCLGLFYVKANTHTLQFFKSLLWEMEQFRDDQKAFNLLLLEQKCEVKGNPKKGFVMTIPQKELLVQVIGKNIVARKGAHFDDSTLIYHPLEKKKVAIKIKKLRRAGVFFLKKNWGVVQYDSKKNYLDQIRKSNLQNYKYIHIGKCAGTHVRKALNKMPQFHHRKPVHTWGNKYIIWIRNPLDRFVSAFNMSYSIINQDTSKLDVNKITFKNSLAPKRTMDKMRNKYAFSERYDELIKFFGTANNLAESITHHDSEIRKKAKELMKSEHEHIFRGIGWYLENGDFIKKRSADIAFVGKVETMDEDLEKLFKLLGRSFHLPKKKIRENKGKNSKYLSPLAIQNLIHFYQETDYRALKELEKQGWITKETLQSYYEYEE